MISTIGNLYTLLNNTGLQAKDNSTYLALKGIIDGLNSINTDYATLSGTPPNILKGTNSFENVVDLDSGQLHFPQIPNPSIDPNTLDDYEEGNWTPIDASGAGLVLTIGAVSSYIKVGRLVYINFFITFPATVNGSLAKIGGLPFPITTIDNNSLAIGDTNFGSFVTALLTAAVVTSPFVIFVDPTGALLTNAQCSGKRFIVAGCYLAQS
jgi:hypothetical protein